MINRFDKELVLVIDSNVDTDKDNNILNIWIDLIRDFI
jgi:hypothetical protein